MTEILPHTAVIRVSRGNFDPARFEEVDRMAKEIGTYLIPAIQKLACFPTTLVHHRLARWFMSASGTAKNMRSR
jgi:hypothetical protein